MYKGTEVNSPVRCSMTFYTAVSLQTFVRKTSTCNAVYCFRKETSYICVHFDAIRSCT